MDAKTGQVFDFVPDILAVFDAALKHGAAQPHETGRAARHLDESIAGAPVEGTVRQRPDRVVLRVAPHRIGAGDEVLVVLHQPGERTAFPGDVGVDEQQVGVVRVGEELRDHDVARLADQGLARLDEDAELPAVRDTFFVGSIEAEQRRRANLAVIGRHGDEYAALAHGSNALSGFRSTAAAAVASAILPRSQLPKLPT